MSRHWALITLILFVLAAPAAPPRKPAITFAEIEKMKVEQLRKRLGPPQHIARQFYTSGCLEQWIYGAPHSCRIRVLRPLGREPQIQGVSAYSPNDP